LEDCTGSEFFSDEKIKSTMRADIIREYGFEEWEYQSPCGMRKALKSIPGKTAVLGDIWWKMR
jgi:hypothetical protein